MKSLSEKRIAIALAVASLAALSGCGKGSDPAVAGIPGATLGAYGAGGCVPINQQIPFTASNIYFDWANIVGGAIPQSGQSIGQMIIGGPNTGGPYQRSGVDGTISLNIVQGATPYAQSPYPGYPTNGTYPSPYGAYNPTTASPSTASGNGVLSISPQTQQDIMNTVGGYGATGVYGSYPTGTYPTGTYPYGTAPTNLPCVSGIAVNVGHYYNTIYGGNVYLYLNNSTHGYVLYF